MALVSEVFDTNAAAKYLSLSVANLAQLRHRGRGPRVYKIGYTFVYRRSDLDRWARTRSINGRARP